MKLLVISPDYMSHVVPMVQVALEWKRQHDQVVVATGEATRTFVEAAGLEWVELRLGRGSNSGVIRAEEQPDGEDDHLRAFFDATREGPVATLRYQADARRHDLLHEPDRVLDRLTEILADVQPDRVVVDHVAFGARLALFALDVDAATMVLGHPSALPAPGEWYGLPPEWPASMVPARSDLSDLSMRCQESVEDLRRSSQELIDRRAPGRGDVGDLTSTPGRPTIYVYPEALHDPARPLPDGAVFVGALVRHEELGDVELPTGDGPRVTVALGSFLSAREDVLAVAVEAARNGGWRLSLAYGSSDPSRLGRAPDGSLIRRHLPQVALLEHTDVLVHHGGNGSLTEAVAAGVPMLVLPFSTDQFAAAAAVERSGLGVVLAPNTVTASALAAAFDAALGSDAPDRARATAASVASEGGASVAVEAIARVSTAVSG
ncbi:glycosyltransferase [soil metagenome]